MNYFSRCLRCKRRRDLTKAEFSKFLTSKLKSDLEARTRDPAAAAYATMEFQSGCPECKGSQGQTEIKVVLGKRKVSKH